MSSKLYDIIIIGSGMAGLFSAYNTTPVNAGNKWALF